MSNVFEKFLADEDATVSFAAKLGGLLPRGGLVFLEGELGAGKTTLARGILRSFGHTGAVKSPTFTLVEPYELKDRQIFHFDLYRLNDPNELEYIGVDDYLDGQHLCLVEWPERGADFLPDSDLTIRLSVAGTGRRLAMEANTELGEYVIRQLAG